MKTIFNVFNFIRTNLITYFLAFIGCTSLIGMFYIRFIKERLPQDIPFLLTELRFYVILFICINFIYLIKLNIQPKLPNLFMQKLVGYLAFPFASFDNLLKTNSYSLSYIKKIIKYSYPKKDIIQVYLTISLNLVPRVLLVLIFMLDVCYFNQLKYFYWILGLGILPWIYYYYKYSMYHAKELGLVYLELLYSKVFIYEKGWDDMEYEYDEDDILRVEVTPKWKPHPRNKYHEKWVTIREYLDILLAKQIDDMENDYSVEDDYDFEPSVYSKEYCYKQYKEVTGKTKLTTNDYNILEKEFNDIIPLLTDLSCYLHYLPDIEKKYSMQKINILIAILWFIGWGTILIKSIHTLSDISITMQILELFSITCDNINPFINP